MTRVVACGCAALTVCTIGVASAGTLNLDNGVSGVGHVDVDVDDYGSYGRQVSPQADDQFWPPGVIKAENMTFMAAAYMFLVANTLQGGVYLSSYQKAYDLIAANSPGLTGTFTSLQRMVTVPTAPTGTGAVHSAFRIFDTASGLSLDVTLDQRLTAGTAPASLLEQDYVIANTGTLQVVITFHAFWDMDIYFSDASYTNDVVGVGNGLCYVFMHDPGSSTQGGALADGGSTVPISAYYGGKEGLLPDNMVQPAFAVTTSAMQPVWQNLKMPPSWVNDVARVGYNTPGESGVLADTIIGMEHQLQLAPGQNATIRLQRHYGTDSLPCVAIPPSCGNGMLDAGEVCDSGTDTMQCNASTCTAPVCGDGYVNTAAGEQCESNMLDTADCNGTTCALPACGDGYLNLAAGEACDDGADTATCNLANCQAPACGDGIVNAAAGEQCESGALCDMATCTYEFSLGGGCAGCGAQGGGGSLVLVGFVGAFLTRRRRARRA